MGRSVKLFGCVNVLLQEKETAGCDGCGRATGSISMLASQHLEPEISYLSLGVTSGM